MMCKRGERLTLTVFALILSSSLSMTTLAHEWKAKKPDKGLSVLVLGSGGPVVTNKRASAGYLIFTDGQPRILMDIGGGTIARLGQAKVDVKDLDIMLLSHLHIDHTADLAPTMKMLYFQNRAAGQQRTNPMHIYGADANATPAFSATQAYIDGHFDEQNGLERYLHGFVPAINAGTFAYMAHNISANTDDPMSTIIDAPDGLVVKAIAVKHGPVPAVAYRIEYKGQSVVYSGDTTSITDNMIHLADNADLLIYDTAILDDTGAPFINLHTTPMRMGQVAAAANVKRLILSHITPTTEGKTQDIKRSIRSQGFLGRIELARDLAVYRLR